MSAAARLLAGGKWKKASRGHASLLSLYGDLEGALGLGGEQGTCSYHFHHDYAVIFPDRQEWEEGGSHLLSPGGLVWYTDGSKNGTGTGAGVWCGGPRTRITLALGATATILQAELLAIRTSAEEIRRRGYRGKHIYICSDSRAALKALSSIEVRSGLTRSCITALARIARHNRVKLLWVPSHSGIQGNNEADSLAKHGAVRSMEAIPTSVPVAPGLVKQLIRTWTEDQFTSLWHSSPGAVHTRAFLRGPSEKLGSELTGLRRQRLRWAVGLITGHWFTGSHLRRIGWDVETLCPFCGAAEETAFHLIAECRRLEDARMRVFGAPAFASLYIEETGTEGLLRFAEEAGLVPDP